MKDKEALKSTTVSKARDAVLRYLIAVWSVALALAATLIMSPVVQPGISPLFLLAVMISAWRGGLGAGLLATFLSAVASAFIFLPPKFSFEIDRNDWLQVIVFSFAAVVIGSLSASRKRAEREKERLLIEARGARDAAEQANAVKDEFLAAVSHELRTPLTTIKTLTRIMQRREISGEEQSEFLKDIASECDRQLDLVLNLLDLSRIKSGGLELESKQVDVGDVVRACEKIERIEANEHDHKLVVEVHPHLHFIRADHGALRRALCTIIENAIKFTPQEGQIVLRAYNNDEKVVIEIEDSGRGIRDEDLPYIFDKFYRGRPTLNLTDVNSDEPEVPGAGLGLNLARALITGMKGSIEVKSLVGQGSIFTVRLPVWKGRNNENDRESAPEISESIAENSLVNIAEGIN